ncbi:ATP-dependent helicase/nuclease subunit A [Clostridiales Family XIII bacterium PM5-7]
MWNEGQQKAIDQRETNMLVAAAAGSGKTAVLVERIKKLIIEEGVPIDQMLVVTFTNAAAAEMKEKIRIALNEEIEANPKESQKLREQLRLLQRANISTFHAFALEVIRNFFYLIDLEPGFSICDDAQSTILKEEALDSLLELEFERETEEFQQFLDWYSSDRNQHKIREIIAKNYNVLQALPNWKGWLREQVDQLSMTTAEFEASPLMPFIWSYCADQMKEIMELMNKAIDTLEDADLIRLADIVREKEVAPLNLVAKAGADGEYDLMGEYLADISSARLAAKKEEKEAYESIKDTVGAYRKLAKKRRDALVTQLFSSPLDQQIQEMNQTAPVASTLMSLLLSFHDEFQRGKEAKKLIDFNDIEHYCLEILEHEEAADHYRQRFEYIFIDEYQDTNVLQEEIISKVKRQNNVFMVGDIKQSIYRFRLAEPDIFKDKYARYQNPEQKYSTKIDLNRNYRSKPAILKEINHIFKDIMEDYDEEAHLYPGLDYEGEYDRVPEVKVIDLASIDGEDEELAGLKATEIEALEVSKLIKKNLGKKFYHSKAGEERTLEYRDMVILMRSVRNSAEVFYRVLKEQGIDAYVDDSEGYFDSMEINIIMNLLSVIDNKLQDVPLISVLHSEIFGFSTEELGIIRSEHKQGAYSEAFLWYGSNGNEPELKSKCANALDSIKKWKGWAASMPLGKFIWKLMIETNHYLIMGAMPAGRQRQANLRALIDKAEKFSVDRQSSLYSFMNYIEAVKKRGVATGQVKLVGEADNLVRIMTIHKSKGLEFPMVIVAGMGKRLNYEKLGRGVYLHKNLGIGMTLSNYEENWYKQTMIQKLIQILTRKEERGEEIRVLYVALTRARDLLYMIGTTRDGQKFLENREIGISGDSTYLDMIQSISKLQVIPCSGTECSGDKVHNDSGEITFDAPALLAEREEVFRRLDYVYPHQEARRLKSKYAVTELNQEEHEKNHISRELAVPKFRQGEKKLTAAEKGTVYHGIMERIDFVRGYEEGMTYLIEATKEMIAKEIFTEEEIEAVDLKRIEGFFSSDLGKRCATAAETGTLQRERPFNLQYQKDGETIIVQGIIDCYFEEADGLVLLDYKATLVNEDKVKETYKKQIEIYGQALEAAKGKRVKEAYLYHFGLGKMIEM